MIYLDNAATSFPKPNSVIREVTKCISKYCGNPGRSSHQLAIAAADKIFETREVIADFVKSNKCENVIFTPNATYALNMVIKGLVSEGCHCIVSDLEHNSVLRPMYKALKIHHGRYSIFNTDRPLTESIYPLIENDTKIIISTICSNVTGKIINLSELSTIAKKYGLSLILDASQYLGHKEIDLSDIHYSALCSAGHKGLFGIQGSGFAIINDQRVFDTLYEGGSGVDSFSSVMPLLLPERFEAGTLSTPAIASLGAGIQYLNAFGMQEVDRKLCILTESLKNKLESIPRIRIYGAEAGIASFNVKDYPSSYISDILNKHGIASRSGFHCSPLIHQKLGTTNRGAVRISLSIFNTEKDIQTLYKVLKAI